MCRHWQGSSVAWHGTTHGHHHSARSSCPRCRMLTADRFSLIVPLYPCWIVVAFSQGHGVRPMCVQVREYFVKTGVFQILASHRSTSGTSARPSVSATTAAPGVSAGSPQDAPGAPSASSSPPQDPTQFAIRMHDHATAAIGRRGGPEEATATDLLRDSTLDSETQRRLQLAAGAFRDPGAHASARSGAAGGALPADQHGSGEVAAAAGQPQQPLHALLHAIDVLQEHESSARPSEANMDEGAAGAGGPAVDAAAAATASGGMLAGGHLHDAAALLLATSGAGVGSTGAGAASVSLPLALAAGSGADALGRPQLPLALDVQHMLAGALRAQLVGSAPMPWAYGNGTGMVDAPVGSAAIGLDALALQHWWATAGGLPGASAPAGDAVLREVQNMFGDAAPAPKE